MELSDIKEVIAREIEPELRKKKGTMEVVSLEGDTLNVRITQTLNERDPITTMIFYHAVRGGVLKLFPDIKEVVQIR